MREIYTPEQLDYMSKAPTTVDENLWFKAHQEDLLLLANTEYGRDLLLIDYEHKWHLPIVELGVSWVVFDASKELGPRKRIGKFHSRSKFASVIRTRWTAVKDALNRLNLLHILSLPKLVVTKSGLHVPVPAGAASLTAYPTTGGSSPCDGWFYLNFLASGPGAIPASSYGKIWSSFVNFTTTDTDDDCDWSGSSSNYYQPYSWVEHKGMKTYASHVTVTTGWEQSDVFASGGFGGVQQFEKMMRAAHNVTSSAIGSTSTIDSAYWSSRVSSHTEYSNWVSRYGDPDWGIYGWSPAQTTNLQCADYSDAEDTIWSITRAHGDLDYHTRTTWTFVAAGESGISKTGITSLMVRSVADATNTKPTYFTGFTAPYQEGPSMSMYSADKSGTTDDPYLSVTYTLPTTAAVTGEIGDGATEQEVRSAT